MVAALSGACTGQARNAESRPCAMSEQAAANNGSGMVSMAWRTKLVGIASALVAIAGRLMYPISNISSLFSTCLAYAHYML